MSSKGKEQNRCLSEQLQTLYGEKQKTGWQEAVGRKG
jgi:hypothetical protein